MKTTHSTSTPSYIKKGPVNRSHTMTVVAIAAICVILFSIPFIMIPSAMSPDNTTTTKKPDPFENLNVSYIDIEIEIGDSISSLAVEYAEHYPGDFDSYIRHIANYNNISNPNEIYIGDHIIIPYYTPKGTGGLN